MTARALGESADVVAPKNHPDCCAPGLTQTSASQALPVHPWSRLLAARCWLDSAEIVGRRLAGLTIGNDLEFDLLSFVEALHAGALDRADMHEDVLAAIIRLNEAEALLAVEPLNGAL